MVLYMKYRSEFKHVFTNTEAVSWRCSIKKSLLKYFAKFTRKHLYQSPCFNTVAGLIKKETPAQVFSCELWEISKKIFFYKTPPVSASSPNPGYLHCDILKALHGFQEKRALTSRNVQFSLQNVPNDIFKIFKMFENRIKVTRAPCWINSKIGKKQKHYTHNILILSLLLVIIMM